MTWGDRAALSWSRSPHIRSRQGSSSCLRKKVRGSKNQIHLNPTLCILGSYDYNDPHSFDSFDGGDESQSLPFSLKVILFTLVTVALILIVFSASVGAICRIQCKVREENICHHKSRHNFLDLCLSPLLSVEFLISCPSGS